MDTVIYVLSPLGATIPVRVAPEASITTLIEALEELELFSDELLDEDWFTSDDEEVTADGTRLSAAATKYRQLTPTQVAATGKSGTDELAGFFAYIAELDGRSATIARRR
jgi:hypothetical protein